MSNSHEIVDRTVCLRIFFSNPETVISHLSSYSETTLRRLWSFECYQKKHWPKNHEKRLPCSSNKPRHPLISGTVILSKNEVHPKGKRTSNQNESSGHCLDPARHFLYLNCAAILFYILGNIHAKLILRKVYDSTYSSESRETLSISGKLRVDFSDTSVVFFPQPAQLDAKR